MSALKLTLTVISITAAGINLGLGSFLLYADPKRRLEIVPGMAVCAFIITFILVIK